jgi:CDP-diacylglycerol--serine O-phosphatidyltransferase
MNTKERRKSDRSEKKRRRGIYLLPNLFTTGCLFAGFYAIVAAMSGRFEAAAIAIFIAMIMDGLDGRVARLTNTQSAFGAFVYTAGTALRLARFNTQVGRADKRYFQGLASPAAAAVIAGMVWVGQDYDLDGRSIAIVAAIITTLLGVFMVSNVRYRSFKDLDLKGRVPFVAILVVVLVFVLISIDPPQILFAGFSLYALSGPVITLITLRRRRAERKAFSQSRSSHSPAKKDKPEE